MVRNKELLQQSLPLAAPWPTEYGEPGNEIEAYINEHVSSWAPIAGFKRAFSEGGHKQGYFTSYSAYSYWKSGKHQYPKGSFAYVHAAFLYLSHIAPVACLGFGEGLWKKETMGGKHAATPPRWEIGDPMNLAVDPQEGWVEMQSEVICSLTGSPFTLISIELANSPLPDKSTMGYSYFDGLQLPPPRLIKDLLFYEGIDWDY